jgi:hypothetical protein
MNENENKSIKHPYYFNNFFGEKFLSKVLTPSKNDKIVFDEKNNKRKPKMRENSCPYIKKRNINESSPLIKFSTSNFFPPLLKGMNNYKKIDSQKKLNGIENYMSNGYKVKERVDNLLLKITKKISLKEIIQAKNNSKFKARNLNQKIFEFPIKNEDFKTNYSSIKNNTIQTSFHNNNNIATIKSYNKDKEFSKIKSFEEKENTPKLRMTKSYDKNIISIKKINKINEEVKSNFLRRTLRFNSNEIYNKKKVMLKYCVYPGNNTKLIDLVMKSRSEIWEKVPTSHYRYCDMVWGPLTSNIDFKTCQFMHSYVNHIPLNEEISNKMRLYGNLIQHCEKKKIDVYKIFPFTIILTLSHHTYSEQIENFKILFRDIDNYTPKSNIQFSKLFNALLNRKIGSKQTINIPRTFNSGKKMWIIKPVNLNRGRCIKVLNNLNSILKEMKLIQSCRKINILEANNNKTNLQHNLETINVHTKSFSPEKEKNTIIPNPK